ncbi:MAG TPA: NIL domain-containing protein [Planctomycetota bacterium]|jgi:hypothetical protein|nr:NIL domain-containing protein [Planctomycetota bacterium]
MPKYFLRFPQQVFGDPVLYVLGKTFQVVPNIRGASITEEHAMMAVELMGEPDEVARAIVWLAERGVEVKPLDGGE